MTTVTVKSIIDPNKSYQYVDKGSPSAAGGMKDIYFSPDKSYVVGFYRAPQDFNSIERLKKIVTTCLLYTSPSPRDRTRSRMPSSA